MSSPGEYFLHIFSRRSLTVAFGIIAAESEPSVLRPPQRSSIAAVMRRTTCDARVNGLSHAGIDNYAHAAVTAEVSAGACSTHEAGKDRPVVIAGMPRCVVLAVVASGLPGKSSVSEGHFPC